MSITTPRATAPLPAPSTKKEAPLPGGRTLQNAPTQMLDLTELEPSVASEDTFVGALPPPAAPELSPQVFPRSPVLGGRPSHVASDDVGAVRELLTKQSTSAQKFHPAIATWPRKLAALVVDALLPATVFVLWTSAEAWLFSADWPEGHGDFLWSTAQWLHLHYGIGVRGLIWAGFTALAHLWIGAHMGQTLGQKLLGLRLVREDARHLTWPWTLGYGLLSFWATACCGANLYFMVVEKRHRTLVQSLLRADLVRDVPNAGLPLSLGNP